MQSNKINSFINKKLKEIKKDWQRFDFFNEGILPSKPSSTGLTLLRRA